MLKDNAFLQQCVTNCGLRKLLSLLQFNTRINVKVVAFEILDKITYIQFHCLIQARFFSFLYSKLINLVCCYIPG